MNRESKFILALTEITFLCGAGFMVAYLHSGDFDKMTGAQVRIPAWVLLGVTFVCASLMPRLPILIWPAAIAGVMLGVGVNAFTDGRDHNLFPLEMVMWAWFTTPGCLAGTLAGCAVGRMRKKQEPKR